ncbi:MAG: TIGR04255 family protein [Micavibrio sp.]
MTSKSPKYDNAPLVELIIGVRFSKIEEFTVPYFGLFWNTIRKEFPQSQMASTLATDNAELQDIIETELGYPLPRLWFINNTDDQLIQVQKNRFLYNWRKRPGHEYPHFETMLPAFEKQYRNFNTFVSDTLLAAPEIQECELSYINHIPVQDAHDNLFSFLSHLNLEKFGESKFLDFRLTFNCDDVPATLIINNRAVKTIIGEDEESEPFYRLEITVRGNPQKFDVPGVNSWFHKAHLKVTSSFENLTDAGKQKTLWGKHEN